MASNLDKHHILEAIDKLRSRKSRPDVLRIVSYVSKKYDFPKNDIKDYLEMLSKDGTVLKVEFKGSISYRNASKYRNSMSKTVSPTSEEESTSKEESLSEVIAGTIGTIAQLIVQEADYLDSGISLTELYNHIDNRHKKFFSKSDYKEVLEKEVKNGNLVKFENGNYCLGYPNGEPIPISPNLSELSDSSNDGSKEKSKSHVSNNRKYNPASRLSSPPSSKNSSTSSLNLSEKSSKVTKPTRTYTKTKINKGKTEAVQTKDDSKDAGANKNESPVREGSRRKRFQKIVFDPSENPKPKKIKEKESPNVQQPLKKVRGPYKKHPKVEIEPSAEKSKKDTTPVSKTTNSTPKTTPVIKEEIEIKSEEVSEEETENSFSQKKSICKICLFNIDLKSPKTSERYIACHVCDKKAHVSCIEDTEHWTRFKLSKWQCNDCKSCVACKGEKESNDVGLILCGLCDDAYHIKCANIKKSKTRQKWFCNKCAGAFDDAEIKTEKEEFESIEATSNGDSSQRTTPEPQEEKKTPEKEPNGKALRKKSSELKDIDESIPDCSNWTCEEVYLYFLKYVLPEEAVVFRDQEIDGKVLLLLTRYDVLCDFKLKLGPALKIYAQVKKLQVRKSDPEIFWP